MRHESGGYIASYISSRNGLAAIYTISKFQPIRLKTQRERALQRQHPNLTCTQAFRRPGLRVARGLRWHQMGLFNNRDYKSITCNFLKASYLLRHFSDPGSSRGRTRWPKSPNSSWTGHMEVLVIFPRPCTTHMGPHGRS